MRRAYECVALSLGNRIQNQDCTLIMNALNQSFQSALRPDASLSIFTYPHLSFVSVQKNANALFRRVCLSSLILLQIENSVTLCTFAAPNSDTKCLPEPYLFSINDSTTKHGQRHP